MVQADVKIELIRKLLDSGQPVSFRFAGTSMSPLISEGDGVLVEPVEIDGARPGEVLAYEYEGRLVAHVLHFSLKLGRQSWLFFKGISNSWGDRPVQGDKVVGKVTHVQINDALQPLALMNINPSSILAWRRFLSPGRWLRAAKGALT